MTAVALIYIAGFALIMAFATPAEGGDAGRVMVAALLWPVIVPIAAGYWLYRKAKGAA